MTHNPAQRELVHRFIDWGLVEQWFISSLPFVVPFRSTTLNHDKRIRHFTATIWRGALERGTTKRFSHDSTNYLPGLKVFPSGLVSKPY